MSNDKTLATVKHGGCVQVGGSPNIEERARELLAVEYRKAGANPAACELMAGRSSWPNQMALNAIVAALAAQPSPGGQDASGLIQDLRAAVSLGRPLLHSDVDEIAAALAARQPVGDPVDDDWHLRGYAYASKQATTCAGCGKHKHTPLRIDAMGGHVCLTCIDQKLGAMLGEFGYPPAQAVDLAPSIPSELAPVVAALKRFNECAEDSGSEGCDIGRDWFDALTTMGLLKRTQRSPAVWTMTAEGERLLALIDSQAVGNG